MEKAKKRKGRGGFPLQRKVRRAPTKGERRGGREDVHRKTRMEYERCRLDGVLRCTINYQMKHDEDE